MKWLCSARVHLKKSMYIYLYLRACWRRELLSELIKYRKDGNLSLHQSRLNVVSTVRSFFLMLGRMKQQFNHHFPPPCTTSYTLWLKCRGLSLGKMHAVACHIRTGAAVQGGQGGAGRGGKLRKWLRTVRRTFVPCRDTSRNGKRPAKNWQPTTSHIKAHKT